MEVIEEIDVVLDNSLRHIQSSSKGELLCDAGRKTTFQLAEWIPIWNHERRDNKIIISFPLEESRSIGSTFEVPWEFCLKTDRIRSFVHDFTYGMWLKTTDVSLGSVFGSSCDQSDKCLTPDYIVTIKGVKVVIEFATRETNSLHILKNAFKEKVDKYSPPLSKIAERLNDNIFLFVIIIGQDSIYSNVCINDVTVRELGYRYKIGRVIKKTLSLDSEYLDKSNVLTDGANDLRNWMKDRTLIGMDRSGEYSEENLIKLAKDFEGEEDQKAWRTLLANTYFKARLKVIREKTRFTTGVENLLKDEENAWSSYTNKFSIRYGSKEGSFRTPEGNPIYKTGLKTIVNVPWICLKTSVGRLPQNHGFWDTNTPLGRAWGRALDSWWAHVNQEEKEVDSKEEIGDCSVTETLFEETERIIESINRRNNDSEEDLYHKKTMRSRNRVKLELDQEDAISFAILGVEGKKHKMDQKVTEARLNSRRSIPIDVDVGDLDRFIKDYKFEELLEPSEDCSIGPTSSELISVLLNQADEIISEGKGNIYDYKEDLLLTVQSKGGTWCKMISDIATELSISFKHHCSSGEFIIKKLKEFNLWLLIKPTRSGSHIFFSMLWCKKDEVEMPSVDGKVFREAFSDDFWCWTDWLSLNNSKLTNWALCESRWISLTHYWTEFYGAQPHAMKEWKDMLEGDDESYPTIQQVELYRESIKMTIFSLIIGLSDKAEVEEVATISRFMIMEGFKGYPLWPTPHKMYEKFPLHIKSRLTVWMIRKMRELSISVLRRPFRVENLDDLIEGGGSSTYQANSYLWHGFENPYTGYNLKDAGQLISLMYLGYIKNKNESSESNVAGKLIDKIIILENQFTQEMEARIGQVNKRMFSETSHEWNISALKHCCKTSKEDLNKSCTSGNIQEYLGCEWIQRLHDTSIEDTFCTLKATSNFDETWFVYKEVLDRELNHKMKLKEKSKRKKENNDNIEASPGKSKSDTTEQNQWENPKHFYSRKKMIERCCEKAPSGVQTMRKLLNESWDVVTKNNYMRVCIFKKQQHGGLREIFVLNFEERIIQYSIELAGRIICEQFHGETMTHPNAKKTMVSEHHKRAKATFKGGQTQSSYTSADSAKWSQNQYCTKLLQILLSFYPVEYHNFFIRALELWRHKRIKISDDLLHLIENQPGVSFWDKTTDELAKAYYGVTPSRWFKKGETFMRVKTGMMQGILHYTSSAFHSIVNRQIDKIIESIPNTLNFKGLSIVATSMQSSDDSGLIISMNHHNKDPKAPNLFRELLASLHHFKSIFSEELAIKDSIKTTHHCPLVYEFNSKFHVGNQLYEPEIKLVFAANLMSHCEDFVSKQEEAYTLVSSLISAGGSCHLAKWVQYSQGFFHYRTLGAQVSTLWSSILYNFYRTIPDPALGFFLTDHPVCSGIPGFNFLYWMAVTSTGGLNRSYKHQLLKLKEIKKEEIKEKESNEVEDILQYMSIGGITRNHNLSFGNRQKLLRMRTRMEIPEDWSDQMDKKPVLFFRNAETKDELLLKIALKLSQKGVAQSLSGTPAISQLLASSVYVIQEKVMSLITSEHIDEVMKATELDIENTKGSNENKNTSKVLKTGSCGKPIIRKREKLSKYSLLELLMAHSKINRYPNISSYLTLEEANLLFPLHLEYSNMKCTLQGMEVLTYTHKQWNKKRVSTDVEVYEGESFSTVNIYSVLSELWFPGVNTRLTSKYGLTQLKLIFSKLQEKLDWLTFDPLDTFKNSPFLSFSALYNWFKTLHNRTRKISIMGAPIISRKGHTSFLSYIKNNGGRYHKLNWRTSESLSDSMESSIPTVQGRFDGVTILINSLVYPSKLRTEVACSVLSQFSQRVKFNHNRTRSRMNNLTVLSSILNNSPSHTLQGNTIMNLTATPDTLDLISSNKEGVTGYWRQRQIWTGQFWSGDGIWEGVINGILTIIVVSHDSKHSEFSFVSSIRVEKELKGDDLRYWSRGLKVWSSESNMSLVFPHKADGKQITMNRWIEGRMKMSNQGIPISLIQGRERPKIDWESSHSLSIAFPSLEEIIERGIITIRLMAKGDHNRNRTILSVSFHSRDWTNAGLIDFLDHKLVKETKFWDFIHNRSSNLETAKSIIKDSMQGNSNNLLKAVKLNLRGNLSRGGLQTGSTLPITPVVNYGLQLDVEEEILDPPIEDLDLEKQFNELLDRDDWMTSWFAGSDEALQVDKEMFELSNSPEFENADEFDYTDHDLDFLISQTQAEFGEDPKKSSSIWDDVMYGHRWLERTTQDLFEIFNHVSIRKILETNEYNPPFERYITLLELAYDRSFTPIGLSNQYFSQTNNEWI